MDLPVISRPWAPASATPEQCIVSRFAPAVPAFTGSSVLRFCAGGLAADPAALCPGMASAFEGTTFRTQLLVDIGTQAHREVGRFVGWHNLPSLQARLPRIYTFHQHNRASGGKRLQRMVTLDKGMRCPSGGCSTPKSPTHNLAQHIRRRPRALIALVVTNFSRRLWPQYGKPGAVLSLRSHIDNSLLGLQSGRSI